MAAVARLSRRVSSWSLMEKMGTTTGMGENGNYEESKDHCLEDHPGPGTGGIIWRGRPGRVSVLKQGQVFNVDYARPDGFCDEA